MFSQYNLLFLSLLVGEALSHIVAQSQGGQKTCTVTPLGAPRNDVPQIRKAFEDCNNGGKVIFSAKQTYRIAEKIKIDVNNVDIDWSGTWLVCRFRPQNMSSC